MKPLRTRLEQARKQLGIPWDVLERDYLLSWILAGIGEVDLLRDTLVFKGGTALKKCWFGDYRFSEDLDFSGTKNVPTGEAMEDAMQAACQAASRLLDEYAPVEINCQRYTEKDPLPGTFGQVARLLGLQPPSDAFDQIVLVARAGRFAEGLDVLAAKFGDRHPLQHRDLFANIHCHDRTPSCSRGR